MREAGRSCGHPRRPYPTRHPLLLIRRSGGGKNKLPAMCEGRNR